MKKLFILILSLFVFTLAGSAMAANTIVYGENVIDISAIDADWTWNQAGSPYVGDREGIKVCYIIFVPGAISDDLAFLEEDASGAEIFPNFECVAAEAMIIQFDGGTGLGRLMKPFLDFSASTLSTGAKVLIGIAR